MILQLYHILIIIFNDENNCKPHGDLPSHSVTFEFANHDDNSNNIDSSSPVVATSHSAAAAADIDIDNQYSSICHVN